MTTSRVGAVIDALVTTFDAGTTVRVFDGPPVVSTVPADFVLVGCDAEYDSRVPVAQEWAGLGHNSRNETGVVPCTVMVQGGTNIKALRDRALIILGDLEAAIVADPTLGGAVAAGWLLPLNGDLHQAQTENGAVVAISCNVSYRARL